MVFAWQFVLSLSLECREQLREFESAQQIPYTLVGISHPNRAFLLILDVFEISDEFWA